MRIFSIAVLTFFLLAIALPAQAYAKKALPKSTPKSTTIKKSTGSTKGVNIQVQLKNDRRGIIANFSSLEIASNVSYSLIYNSRGIQEGAGGSLSDLSGTQAREILFATCSSGVCRYHTSIKNARFVVTTTLQDGRKVRKTFKIKV